MLSDFIAGFIVLLGIAAVLALTVAINGVIVLAACVIVNVVCGTTIPLFTAFVAGGLVLTLLRMD